MSKSTPLTELNADSGDTQPLVADILKEIEQDPSTVEVKDVVDPIVAQPQMVDTSDVQHQLEQQNQALQYQMDAQAQQQAPLEGQPGIQSLDGLEGPGGQVPLETIPEHPPEVMQMMQQGGHPSMQQDFSQAPASAQTMGQKIFEQARDPILVVLISVLLSVPAVYQTLSSLLSKIPGGSASLAPVILRAVLSGILFFGIRKVL